MIISMRPMLTMALTAVLAGCGSSDPFDYISATGTITYEDGSIIPAEQIRLTFIAQAAPIDKKTFPRPAGANVHVETGAVDFVTSRNVGDGLIPGKHKVLVEAFDGNERPLPVVGPEYRSAESTPLEVDTAKLPFELKVKKPAK